MDDPFDFAEDAQSYGFEKVLISGLWAVRGPVPLVASGFPLAQPSLFRVGSLPDEEPAPVIVGRIGVEPACDESVESFA